MKSVTERQTAFGLDNQITVEPRSVVPQCVIQKGAIASLNKRFGSARFTRGDFSPAHIPGKAIAHLSLLDVRRGETQNSYTYRVFGSEMRATIGTDLTHKTVLDYPRRTCRTYLMRLFDECVLQERPVFSNARIDYPGERRINTEKTFIPLFTEDHHAVEMVLTIFTFQFLFADPDAEPVEVDLEPLEAHERFKVFADLGQLAAAAQIGDGLHAV